MVEERGEARFFSWADAGLPAGAPLSGPRKPAELRERGLKELFTQTANISKHGSAAALLSILD